MGGGALVNKTLGRYVPPTFSKIGSPELIFGLETFVLGTKFAKICVLGAKNLVKIGNIDLEM